MKLILFFSLFILNPCFSSVFKNINENPIILSDEILNLIDQELVGKKNEPASLNNILSVDTFIKKENRNLSKVNLCYKFQFFSKLNEFVNLKPYSNTKLSIPDIDKNGFLNFAVKNLPNNLQLSFSTDGFYPINLYLGNSAGVEINCNEYEIPVIKNSMELGLEDGKAGIIFSFSEIFDELIIDDINKQKIYLDEYLKVVKNKKMAKFILFTNLSPGNTVVKYGIPGKGIASELVHLISEEITFLDDKFVHINDLKVEFYKKNLLSNSDEPFLDTRLLKQVLPGNFQAVIKDKYNRINILKRKNSKLIVHNDIKIQGKNLYYQIGASDQKIVIPSEEYASLFFERNNLDQSNDFCIVQINLHLKPIAIYAGSSSGDIVDTPDVIIKDKFGKMSTTIQEYSEVAYLIGYLDGIIDYRIAYKDGTSQFGQVPCSKKSYIIEQLI